MPVIADRIARLVPPMIEYDDFVIQIGPPSDGFHTVTVLQSPAGSGGRGRFPVEWHSLTDGAGATMAPPSPPGTDRSFRPERRAVPDPATIGQQLYEALFTGEIESLFEQSLGTTLATGRRLRVRLQLNVEHDRIAPLATIPWELMYRRRMREHLVLSPQTTLVRSLDVPVGAYPAKPITESTRVLFVMANPKGDLNLAAERAEIEAQLSREAPTRPSRHRATIVPHFLENATFAALEELLRDEDFHIIHFMGHGEFDASRQGQLLFQDGPRSGRDLGDVLRRERTTRLVTLNACRTGEGSGDVDADPFAGVATALMMAGVPAVVAMQFPVSDKAAIAFSARLYAALGGGDPLEEAVDSGRMRIKAMAAGQREWATPVLFLRDTAPTLVFNVPALDPVPQTLAAPLLASPAAPPAAAAAPPPRHTSQVKTIALGAVLGGIGLFALLVWMGPGDDPATSASTASSTQASMAPAVPAATAAPESAETAIGRAYLQAISGGSGSRRVDVGGAAVDYDAIGCAPDTVWVEDKCQRLVLDDRDGKTLFMQAITTGTGTETWEQSNIQDLLPEADLRRIMADPGLRQAREMLLNMSDPDNDWFVEYAGRGGAKHILRQYMDAVRSSS
jgi:hypothetical protein